MQKIIEALLTLQKNAYAPYSHFRVAAIIETNNGDLIKGVNVENASYPLGSCAEKNAFGTAISLGYSKSDFKNIYILGDSEIVCAPCGGCRQVLAEFLNDNVTIHLFNNTGKKHQSYNINELLPTRFSL
ncbi:cytidine deaminase [Rickettsiales bacterium LUAb2]